MKKLTKGYFVVFTITFLLVYLVSCFVLWFYSLNYSYQLIKIPLEKYIQNHQAELKSKVFNQYFPDAKNCSQMSTDNLKEQCRQSVTYKLAVTIIEEELAGAQGYNWPDDLFFVEQKNGHFYRMGWEAEYADITSSIHSKIPNPLPFFMQVLTKNCRDFEATLNHLPSCTIYTAVDLGNNQTGYVVRRLGLTEENELPLMFLFPPLLIIPSVISLSIGNFDSESWFFLVLNILCVVLPLPTALLATRIYKSKTAKKVWPGDD